MELTTNSCTMGESSSVCNPGQNKKLGNYGTFSHLTAGFVLSCTSALLCSSTHRNA
jgi:hypothetical protein